MTPHEEPPPTGSTTSPGPVPWPVGAGCDLTGRTLGDFRVERLLGHGGMGAVYLACQKSLDRPVALKVLRPELWNNPADLARFETEAWTAARLSHPNIVHIYTLGCADGVRFLAMEYVPGTNLREHLARKGVPDLAQAIAILRQAGLAIGAAGEVGLVHRDIKPENLLLTGKGQVKVADFGLCRGPGAEKLQLTQPGVTLGTPLYMSPEQVLGQPLDQRSDLYSLGVTAYQMLAGFPPFQADSPLAMALKHVHEPPVPLAVHRPDLPEGLADLVMKLMARDPADRYPSADAMLDDLAKFQGAAHATTALQRAMTVAESPTAPTIPWRSGSPALNPTERGGRRGVVVPAAPRSRFGRRALAILLLLALLAGAAWGWHDRPANLLAAGAPTITSPPGLWMEPWSEIPRLRTARAQYRYAQTTAAPDQRLAAWLAVPGRFPNASEVGFQAYVQFTRELFRRRDADRLGALADEFDAWERGSAQRPLWQILARISRAGAGAIRGDAMAVKGQFQEIKNLDTLDPAIAELGLEVVLRARRPGARRETDEHLIRLRNDLLKPLGLAGIAGLPGGPRLLDFD